MYKHKQELEELEQKHTLGKVNFDSVLVIDFGERLKSVLTSFMFSDVLSSEVNFFTLNQWFDETFFKNTNKFFLGDVLADNTCSSCLETPCFQDNEARGSGP